MPRKRTDRDDAAPLFEAVLDAVDTLHVAVVKFGGATEIEPSHELTSDDVDDLPESRFLVGDEETGPERGGGLVLDTRLSLSLDPEQAETLLFELARAVREGGKEISLPLDGRLVIGRDA